MSFEEALKKATTWMDEVDGVEGVAEGEQDGERCISVFVTRLEVAEDLPASLEGHTVVVEVTDEFEAQ